MIEIVPLATVDPASVEALLDRAFGTDRHRRTAYAVRGAATAIPDLSFAALANGAFVGSVQCWPVDLLTDAGSPHRLTMVGPVAVAPERQGDGVGRQLMEQMLAAADAGGPAVAGDGLMLIGDPGYYERFFGFTAAATGRWRVPGPVERHRLLARGDGVPDAAGVLGPAMAIAA